MRRLLALAAILAAPLLAPAVAPADDPPCAAGSAPPLTLQAPSRLAYGARGTVTPRLATGAQVAGYTIALGDAATVTGDPAHPAPVHVRQRLDAAPMRIVLTTTERAGDATCRRVQSATVHGFRHLYVQRDCVTGVQRPRTIARCISDGPDGLRRLHWRHWNRDVVTGHGLWRPGCQAIIGGGCPSERPATLRLTAIRRCPTGYFYTHLRVQGGGDRAFIELGCPNR